MLTRHDKLGMLSLLNLVEISDQDGFGLAYPLLSSLIAEEDPSAYTRLTSDLAFSNFQKAKTFGFHLLAAVLAPADGQKTVIGTIGIRPFYDPLSIGVGFEINDFIVSRPWRGTGVARRLFDFAERRIREEGGSWIRGMVMLSKPGAKLWYERIGYHVVCNTLYKEL